MDVIEQVKATKIVPVVKIEDASKAVALADALSEGGISCAEITFRTAAAPEAIANIAKARPDFFVGAGTVINAEQAAKALDAGAQFLVSPGFSPKVAEYAAKRNAVLLPGVCTPTEIMAALEYGITYLKFFPADVYGGVKAMKALSAPFGGIKFMPTGGVNLQNVREILSAPFVFACGGSWLAPAKLIAADDFAGITALCREAMAAIADI